MQNLLNDLVSLLEKDERLVFEGQILKNKVVEMALGFDAGLLQLLLSHKDIRRHFFADVGKVAVFDKIKFQQFVMNKQFLPDSYTTYKNKIGLTVNGQYLTDSKEVVLAWPYRDCVLEGGQTKEDSKRDEVFWNETLAPDQIDRLLAPKVLTNFKKFDKLGEHKVTGICQKDNLIIKGNNLVALHTLKMVYARKVKLIYIDPPYNTGGDSFKYNDSFNHSTWLTFMRNRLSIARELLRDDGVIFIQCDDNEQAYLKVLLDEIFGRENFVNTISINLKNVAGASGGGEDKKLKKNIEYIHVYAKNYMSLARFKAVYEYTPIEELVETYRQEGVSWKYTTALVYEGDKKYIGSTTDGSGDEIKIFSRKNPIIKSINQIMKDEKVTEKEAYRKYAKKIFQTAMPQSSIRPRVMKKVQELGVKGDLFSIEYTPKTGKNKATVYEQYYKGDSFRLFAWLADVSEEIDGVLCKKDSQGTYWDFAKETKNLSKEGDVELLSGKKPERLLEKIINMASEEGDIVLDYHLGSGTTCAVALKTNRKFIGLEQIDYGENDSVVRLNRVLQGEQSGISKDVKWTGGGSFVSCELSKANQIFFETVGSAKTPEAVQSIWGDMQDRAFLSYRVEGINPDSKEFKAFSLDDQKRILIDILDKNMLYVPYSEIDDKTYGTSAEDKKLNRQLHEGEGE